MRSEISNFEYTHELGPYETRPLANIERVNGENVLNVRIYTILNQKNLQKVPDSTLKSEVWQGTFFPKQIFRLIKTTPFISIFKNGVFWF